MALPFVNYRRRIALTGLGNSGKTVFLTSLLDHLANHSDDLTFQKGAKIESFSEIPIAAKGIDQFPFTAIKKGIAENHTFPSKTVSESRYRCLLTVRNWRASYQLEFLDFPGERFADVWMMGKTYEAWSDAVGECWAQYRISELDDFERVYSEPEVSERECISAFRRFLAAKVLAFHPHISPSTFRLGQTPNRPGGTVAHLKGRTLEALLESGTFAGVSAEQEFVPLSRRARELNKHLAATMATMFNEYKRRVVEPLFSELQCCDRLIVLVDIPFLLSAGANARNENHELLKTMLKAASPVCGPWEFLKWLSWSWSRVTKVAFVASKSDLVIPADHDRMLSLVKAFIQPHQTTLRGMDVGCFTASAVKSTEVLADECDEHFGTLVGKPKYESVHGQLTKRSPEMDNTKFRVSRLPDRWPLRAAPNQYAFPEVHPAMPDAAFVPPPHENLGRVLDFVLR